MNDRVKNSDEWYANWFDTSYYHLLYKNRNEEEAELFLNNLIQNLSLSFDTRIWDMACGKGRHANYLSKKGMNVLGTDLSENSIKLAKENFNYENLEFSIHDMRTAFRTNYFGVVLNVFTSMGYFTRRRDDERVFISAQQSLKKDGVFVVDFMNSKKVISNLVGHDTKTIEGVFFEIKREINDGVIIKTINVVDGHNKFEFNERVRAYQINDLIEIAKLAGFGLKDVFGNYALEEFNESNSDRLIMIFNKK